MMNDLGKIIFKRIQEAKERNGGQLDMNNVDVVISTLVESIKGYVSDEAELSIYSEMEKTLTQLKVAKEELKELNPASIGEDFLPGAAKELDAVTEATEQSTNTILDAVEVIQGLVNTLADKELQAKINAKITEIFEACNFQDITGQRISKVSGILGKIETIIDGLMGKLSNKGEPSATTKKKEIQSSDKDLLNGPQLSSNAPSQDEIDNLFG